MDTSLKFGVVCSYNAGCSQKRDKIVPPSFKVFVKKKANHIFKQTFCIADRRMVSVQCT